MRSLSASQSQMLAAAYKNRRLNLKRLGAVDYSYLNEQESKSVHIHRDPVCAGPAHLQGIRNLQASLHLLYEVGPFLPKLVGPPQRHLSNRMIPQSYQLTLSTNIYGLAYATPYHGGFSCPNSCACPFWNSARILRLYSSFRFRPEADRSAADAIRAAWPDCARSSRDSKPGGDRRSGGRD